MNGPISASIKKYVRQVDWNLLIFLLLFLNVKLVIKAIGICFIYLRKFNFSFGFSFRNSRLPLFYPAMIGIALINVLLFALFKTPHYTVLLFAGISFWILSILAIHQLKLAVEKTDLEKIHFTILVFFVINAIVSFGNLFVIMLDAGVLNPYRYQGMYQKYFIGTGDFIRGVSFDTSTMNALLNAFGVLYFLYRKNYLLSILCMVVMLLTFSNLTILLVCACFVFLFLFRTNRDQKSILVIELLLVIMFLTAVSPQNNDYALRISRKFFGKETAYEKPPVAIIPITERPDSVLSADEQKYKHAKLYLDSVASIKTESGSDVADNATKPQPVKLEMHKENIHAPESQHKQDSSETRFQAISYLKTVSQQQNTADTISKKIPGKATAYIQLFRFLKEHPAKMLTGNGLGNFSSKIAFRASGLKIAGAYPAAYRYMNEDFERNHMLVYLAYFSTDSVYHSIANSPNSVFAQLLGEYGLLGLFFFLFFYARYFGRSFQKLTYGLPILLIMMGAFISEYWFEQLSVVVLFELLMLMDRKSSLGEEQKA